MRPCEVCNADGSCGLNYSPENFGCSACDGFRIRPDTLGEALWMRFEADTFSRENFCPLHDHLLDAGEDSLARAVRFMYENGHEPFGACKQEWYHEDMAYHTDLHPPSNLPAEVFYALPGLGEEETKHRKTYVNFRTAVGALGEALEKLGAL